MKLYLSGHDCRYAIEQMCLSLFPDDKPELALEPFTGDGAVSALHRTADGWQATAEITRGGRTVRAARSAAGDALSEPLRRQLLRPRIPRPIRPARLRSDR